MESQDLRNAGLKVTAPRMKILEVLETSKSRHMSAEDVYKALLGASEDIGLATVYRVLTQFEAAGLVSRHHFEDGHAVFEMAHEEHHDHMVCVECGKIVEFYDQSIEDRQRAIAEREGFEIVDHSLILHVRCKQPACQNKRSRALRPVAID